MIKKILFLSLVLSLIVGCDTPFYFGSKDFQTPFERSEGTKSATYDEVIDFYKRLSSEFSTISLRTVEQTDSGVPLHLVIYSPDAEFNLNKYQEERTIVFINNATYGNDTDGVDATMLLFRNLAQNEIKLSENVIVVAIPVYNIGALQGKNYRKTITNYDLNLDVIKSDTQNALSFAKIFQMVHPDVFIDNYTHYTAADYQYVLTYTTSQTDKLGNYLGTYLREQLLTKVSDSLLKRQEDFQKIADSLLKRQKDLLSGKNEQKIAQKSFKPKRILMNDTITPPFWRIFPEETPHSPAQAIDYATLYDCMGIRINTHVKKPYRQRVEANYEMMKTIVEVADRDYAYIKQLKIKQKESNEAQKNYALSWAIDSTQCVNLPFYTYEIDTITEVVHLNHQKPLVQEVAFYNRYKPTKSITIPQSYIVPKVFQKVIDRLKANNVQMTMIDKDTLMSVVRYKIESFKTLSSPVEGHYWHYDTHIIADTTRVQLYKGDYQVPLSQPAAKYLLEVLEPEAPDSFFNWNFFDNILTPPEEDSLYSPKPIYPIYRKL